MEQRTFIYFLAVTELKAKAIQAELESLHRTDALSAGKN
jgi:hypothetical protein